MQGTLVILIGYLNNVNNHRFQGSIVKPCIKIILQRLLSSCVESTINGIFQELAIHVYNLDPDMKCITRIREYLIYQSYSALKSDFLLNGTKSCKI